jgi:sulfide:quinone oxidoreductase
MKRTLILGGGFGGITVATQLRALLGGEHEVVVVDRREDFTMGLRKLWAIVGVGSIEEGSRSRQLLADRDIDFVQTRITEIDPARRGIETDSGTMDGDYLVVAVGAESRPELVPGLGEHCHNVWDVEGVPALESALAAFEGGSIAVVIAGVPYSCPPAPYECTLLIDDYLRQRGLRERTELSVATLQPMLLPNAGKAGSAWLAEQLTARGVEFRVGSKVERFEPGRAVFADGQLEADLIIAVPPHRPPQVVAQSGLTGESGWIAVDESTLATVYPGVFAIGDVTSIKLGNGLPLPKAGIMAELQGNRVAAAIAAEVLGQAEPPAFDGQGFCFMETGLETAALIRGDFYAKPEPRVELADPSKENALDKHRFEAERLRGWFGG